MKAAIYSRYGSPDGVEVRQIAKPDPRQNEVRVRVHATTVSRTDCGMLRGKPALFVRPTAGLLRPLRPVLGLDFAGTIEAVGSAVTEFRPGERVFGMSPERFGAHADFLCVPENGAIATIPPGLAFEEAVLCEGAWYAESNLRRFALKTADRILIYGASGAIGTAAVQLARSRGAEVTAVVATRHLDLLKELGADRVLDYTAGDFTRINETFDYVFDAVGKTSYFRCKRLLKPTGVFAATDLGAWWQNILLASWYSFTRSNRVVFAMPMNSASVVTYLKERMEARELRAVIDRRYSLESIADAYRYVESAQKTGIVVLRVGPAECEAG